MGRRYSFILVAKKRNKKIIENLINADSDEKHNLATDKALSIYFPKDSSVSAYLHDEYPDPSVRKSLIKDGTKGKIECIYFEKTPIENSDYARYKFTATTKRKSDLFYMSTSVQNWFKEMGKASGALIVYFDYELSASIIYSDGEKIGAFFEDDYYEHLDPDRFCEVIAAGGDSFPSK
jgi:hypothetical protein